MQVSYLGRLQLREGDRQSAAFPGRTEELDLESKMVSGGVGRLGGLGVSFIGRRRGARGGAGIWLSSHVNWISRDGLGVGLWS